MAWEKIGLLITSQQDIAASGTTEMDVISLSESNCTKWLIYLDDNVSKTQSLEVYAREKSNIVDYNEYAILGDDINYDLALASDGTDMTLSITNNEAGPLTVRYIRITV